MVLTVRITTSSSKYRSVQIFQLYMHNTLQSESRFPLQLPKDNFWSMTAEDLSTSILLMSYEISSALHKMGILQQRVCFPLIRAHEAG